MTLTPQRLILSVAIAAIACQASAKTGTATYDIDTGGPNLGGDYYGSGQDDSFGEYGITTFNFSPADFGGPVTAITGAELTLTVNDRTFSDGAFVELFYTPDTGADLDNGGGDFSSLVFDDPSSPSGIDPSQFVTAPVSLGVFSIPEMAGRAGGETDTFTLPLASIEASLISQINSGSDFQILIAATEDTHDITYSGVGNTFDPGDPDLVITATVDIPEPASALLLLVGAAAALAPKRR